MNSGEIAFLFIKNGSRRGKQKNAVDCSRAIVIDTKSNSTLNGRLESFMTSNPYIIKGQPVEKIIEILCPDFINLSLNDKVISLISSLAAISKTTHSNGNNGNGKSSKNGNGSSAAEYYSALAQRYIGLSTNIPDILKYDFEQLRKTLTDAETIYNDTPIPKAQVYRVVWT